MVFCAGATLTLTAENNYSKLRIYPHLPIDYEENMPHNIRRVCGLCHITYTNSQIDWPHFFWDYELIDTPQAAVRHRQGVLLGRMENIGFPQRDEAILQTLTLDVYTLLYQISRPELLQEYLPRQY